MRILAVDDDPSIRDLLPMILAEAGWEDVSVAESARQALQTINEQEHPFECFFLDIQMPGANGIELCGAIRRLNAHRRTPIIMLTAMSEKSFIDEAFAAGATDYATKPFDFVELRARVRMAKLLADQQKESAETEADLFRIDSKDDPFVSTIVGDDIKGLIPKQALSNYLSQMSQAGAQTTIFFAVHIRSGRKIFEQGTLAEFEYAVSHVADALLACAPPRSVFMSYIGCGNFLCVASDTSIRSAEWLETETQNCLDDKNLTFDDGAPLDVEIVVGAAVQPLLCEAFDLEALEPQAIKRAMVRLEKKYFTPDMPNIRYVKF